ncbi:MAG TPA: MFS transporter [Xanthobacteraceae bacterium]|nr:MFS transporter [Xanthobacteraceae bacterium]
MTIYAKRPCDEAAIESTRVAGACAASAKPWVLAVTILASSISYIDESVVNVALPAIETDLKTSAEVIQWLVNAYTLCLSAFLLVGGSAGDLFGRRRIFVVGVAIFAVMSIWCGLSPDVFQLLLARGIQGAGAALLIPCSLAIIGATFDEAERGKAIGTWAGFSAIASAVGPLLGGWIVDHFSWRWIFLINPVLALPVIWIALNKVPESRDMQAKGGLDWRGSLLALAALGSLAFGLMSEPVYGWRSPVVIGALLIGLLLLAAFIWEEARNPAPMLPLRLFRSRTFSAVNLLTLLLYAATGGTFFFLPFALIQVGGFSAVLAGAAFLPFTLIMATLSRWGGGLLDRFGAKRPLIIGPAIAALAFALLAWPIGGGSYGAFLVPIAILGFGMVITVAPLTATVMDAVPDHETGVAAGINNAVASVANLLAVAVLGALALGLYDRGLDRHLADKSLSSEVVQAIGKAKGQFVIAPALEKIQGNDRQLAEGILKGSLAKSIQSIMLVCAALALAGAISSTLLPSRRRQQRSSSS